MTHRVYDAATHVFDPLHAYWESETNRKIVTALLVALFLSSLIAIELNRQALLPDPFREIIGYSHFQAINAAFTLVLLLEVVSLIFVLPCSVSKSVGKQFEILALILLRNSFKELVYLPEPIQIGTDLTPVLRILSDGFGALAIFVILGFYYRQQKHRGELMSGETRYRFVAAKKLVALGLLVVFLGLGLYGGWDFLFETRTFAFFATFYTVLIFSDILLVLVSHRFLPTFHAVLRNSGYAVSTLLLRLSLTAPPYYDAGIGVAAALFALSLTWTYNNFYASGEG
ncbi:hypothetical protein SAMN05660653_00021 [Desulfonatronum thiosulfatophilum]|uniref:Uncharacterized protein n=2 Tax=Desulfonatronum thiosulfatophilum TaxID=617002 RepID=A0A1G6A045_9BACT|nr:hypothetical protein SAMN05660653_00021 [Desulfonatronum thiosulfatophilum]